MAVVRKFLVGVLMTIALLFLFAAAVAGFIALVVGSTYLTGNEGPGLLDFAIAGAAVCLFAGGITQVFMDD